MFFRTLSALILSFLVGTLAANVAQEKPPDIMRDLCIAHHWDKVIHDRLPVYYNHTGIVGYFSMPSALSARDGTFSFGYAYIPPYRNWMVNFQFMDRLELIGTYRIFYGMQDANLSPLGFGDYADKGINFKIALLRPEDTDYTLPGLAFGWDDFLGSRLFEGQYLVATQVIRPYDLEVSLGWGWGRYKGPFGAAAWTPWRQCPNSWLKGLTFILEYDDYDYRNPKHEPHPKGRIVNTRFNPGIKYRPWKYLEFSASYIRGYTPAASVFFHYNLGETKGLLPKIKDPLPYRRPVNTEPIGKVRPLLPCIDEIAFALKDQGFSLQDVYLDTPKKIGKELKLRLVNQRYRKEEQAHMRIANVLAALMPSDVTQAVVILEDEGLDCQQYRFRYEDLKRYREKQIGFSELDILSYLKDVEARPFGEKVYHKQLPSLLFNAHPQVLTYFGSSKGKFKYTIDMAAYLKGYVFGNIYYDAQANFVIYSTASDIQDMDFLNPSQIINVHSDLVNYSKTGKFNLDHFYLQKSWNLGKGFFGRLSGGYFESAYAGGALEGLYYPAGSHWAFGLEGAVLKKRAYTGIGFQHELRKLIGYAPTFIPYSVLTQYFFDIYYDLKPIELEFKLAIGKFLAKDFGVRTEMSRYFKSGLRVSVWYTITNGHDSVNNSIYYDKGVAISLPLDIFLKHSDREQVGTGMSAWLRDVGYRASTGKRLFNIINENRRY